MIVMRQPWRIRLFNFLTAVKKLFHICDKALAQLSKSFTTTVLKLESNRIFTICRQDMKKSYRYYPQLFSSLAVYIIRNKISDSDSGKK